MAGKVGMKHYGIEFRAKIVALKESGVTYTQIEDEYGVGQSQVRDWTRWTREYGTPKQITGKPRGRPKKIFETQEQELARLRMENALLKKFHELLAEETRRK